MSAPENAPPQPPISPATTVAWRRRREASLEAPPAQNGAQPRNGSQPRNGFHAAARAGTLAQPVPAPRPPVAAPPPGRPCASPASSHLRSPGPGRLAAR